jgi:excisionase family DNA binding protein
MPRPESVGGVAAPCDAKSEPLDSIEALITGKRVCEILNVSSRTLWGLANAGTIPVVRIGRSVRYRPSDVRSFIENGGAA